MAVRLRHFNAASNLFKTPRRAGPFEVSGLRAKLLVVIGLLAATAGLAQAQTGIFQATVQPGPTPPTRFVEPASQTIYDPSFTYRWQAGSVALDDVEITSAVSLDKPHMFRPGPLAPAVHSVEIDPAGGEDTWKIDLPVYVVEDARAYETATVTVDVIPEDEEGTVSSEGTTLAFQVKAAFDPGMRVAGPAEVVSTDGGAVRYELPVANRGNGETDFTVVASDAPGFASGETVRLAPRPDVQETAGIADVEDHRGRVPFTVSRDAGDGARVTVRMAPINAPEALPGVAEQTVTVDLEDPPGLFGLTAAAVPPVATPWTAVAAAAATVLILSRWRNP